MGLEWVGLPGAVCSFITSLYASRMFSSSSFKLSPWLKTPGTSRKRPTYQPSSRQYSSVNLVFIIHLYKEYSAPLNASQEGHSLFFGFAGIGMHHIESGLLILADGAAGADSNHVLRTGV